ncbi:MAG: PC4/YdbC family ssDNA-binding protein [Absicoccus porci]|uniref:YdbC family protein n=1 Tax=Absicoccus porci TaxID=2486576 RepID=UPI002E79FA2E|nr:PC4/YdbC family ssDNA-binding protein [Absicoccus porci]MEE1354442.1 PC4/YdbC family ssDNA-binding protein [Absicoccus porci]
MKEFKYEIIKNAGVLSKSSKDWRKELNLIRWGDNEPKYDIRDWSGDHGYMGKGVTFTITELRNLKRILNRMEDLRD